MNASHLVKYPQIRDALLLAIELAELSAMPSLPVQIAHGMGTAVYTSRVNGMLKGYHLPVPEEAEALNQFFQRVTASQKRHRLPDFAHLAPVAPVFQFEQFQVA